MNREEGQVFARKRELDIVSCSLRLLQIPLDSGKQFKFHVFLCAYSKVVCSVGRAAEWVAETVNTNVKQDFENIFL